jgi:hypothetical protein
LSADDTPRALSRRGVVAQLATVASGTLLLTLAQPLAAQRSPTVYSARLGWVPISGAERDAVAGRGSATASLSGSALTISGEFEGLPANATVARLHQGVAMGARGPAIADLGITRARAGSIDGRVTLNRAQLEALEAGRLYLQVHSEHGVPPDNSNLWGWLLR